MDFYERILKSRRASFRVVGESSEGAQVIELDGVLGSVCPAVPERSLPNSVVYESQGALIAALPELARRYDEAGSRHGPSGRPRPILTRPPPWKRRATRSTQTRRR